MTVHINLNEQIKVKLTDYGRDIFYHRHDEFNKRFSFLLPPHYPEVDENGYSTFQLWDFMNIYGEYINIGSRNVVQPLEIIYEEWSANE